MTPAMPRRLRPHRYRRDATTRPSATWLPPLWLTSGCSLIYDTDVEQCSTDEDCAARGFADATSVAQVCQPPPTDTAWSCLGAVQWPSSGTGQVELRVMVVDVMTSAPPSDLTVATGKPGRRIDDKDPYAR